MIFSLSPHVEKEETKEEQEEETKEEAQEPGNIIISYTLMVPRYWYLTHELLSLSLFSLSFYYISQPDLPHQYPS